MLEPVKPLTTPIPSFLAARAESFIASAALFNAAQDAEIDLTVPPDRLPPETDTVPTVGDTTLFPTAGGAL